MRGRMAPHAVHSHQLPKKNAGLVGPAWLFIVYFSLPGSLNQTPQYCFTLLELRKFLLKLDSGPKLCRPRLTYPAGVNSPAPDFPIPLLRLRHHSGWLPALLRWSAPPEEKLRSLVTSGTFESCLQIASSRIQRPSPGAHHETMRRRPRVTFAAVSRDCPVSCSVPSSSLLSTWLPFSFPSFLGSQVPGVLH